ncbi:MAG: hypothetical protein OXK77_05905 [Gemmatimonadota bacterium]|nr:hypothetical protein [Gemmatimonadota bacterium]MDE2865872.1 hypothetical protein [Gemmatimonadota bacterium]
MSKPDDCDCPDGYCRAEQSAVSFVSDLRRFDKDRECKEIRQKLNEKLNPGEPPAVSRFHDPYPDACEPRFVEALQRALRGCKEKRDTTSETEED